MLCRCPRPGVAALYVSRIPSHQGVTSSDMGIQSRDYMKRPSDDDGERSSTPDGKVEALLSGFLQRHPRFFIYLGIALVALIIITLLVAKFS